MPEKTDRNPLAVVAANLVSLLLLWKRPHTLIRWIDQLDPEYWPEPAP